MKIFKLKCLALALTLVTLGSCASDDALKDGEKTASKENAFVFEDDIKNYVIDGKLTYDRKEITNAAENAWNVHYDFPNNKVVISTTTEEFEKYKNSDIEFKNALAENERNANDKVSVLSQNKALPTMTDIPAGFVLSFKNKSLITFQFHKTYNKKEGEVLRMHTFAVSSSADMTKLGVRRSTFRVSDGLETEVGASVTSDFSGVRTSNKKFKMAVHNDNTSKTLRKTFYTGKNFKGSSFSISVKPGEWEKVPLPAKTAIYSYN
jgi:hypothetical protein